jgi:hypothetical protein
MNLIFWSFGRKNPVTSTQSFDRTNKLSLQNKQLWFNKKRFKNRMKSPQSSRRVKTILRLLYMPRPFQRYQLCEDWLVGTRCFGARKGRGQSEKYSYIHSRYFFGRTGRIRVVEVRPQKFRANFFRFGRISSIVQPKNLLIWGNFAYIERNSPEIFGAKLNCSDSPISGEKNNYCVG